MTLKRTRALAWHWLVLLIALSGFLPIAAQTISDPAVVTAPSEVAAAIPLGTPLIHPRPIAFDELPPPVQAAVRARAGLAAIDRVVQGTINDRTIYEVSFRREGLPVALRLVDDGTIVADEKRGIMTFGLDRVEALHVKFLGFPLWQYLASLIFVLVALIVSKLLDWLVAKQLRRWAARTRTKLDDLVVDLIQGPVKIVSFVVLLHIGLSVFPWPESIAKWISRGLLLAVAFSVTYMLVRTVDVLVEYWRARARARDDRAFNDQLFSLVNNALKGFVLVVAVLVTCDNLGLDITAAIASLSIGGLALGLAAQDTVANLFGAVAVFVDKPFRVGERIKLDGIDGVVESIGLRSTRVRNLDGHLITVPNKTMGNATITNITRRPNIKTEINISITYDTPAEKVKRALDILDQIYRKHPMTHDLIISFNKFADSSLNIMVIHWWNSTDFRAYLAGMQEMNLAVKERFDAEKLEFAFPTRTLYVKHEGDGRPAELSLASAVPLSVPDNGSQSTNSDR